MSDDAKSTESLKDSRQEHATGSVQKLPALLLNEPYVLRCALGRPWRQKHVCTGSDGMSVVTLASQPYRIP